MPQRSVELPTASKVRTGAWAPEKNATCNRPPETNVTIHSVCSVPQSVLCLRKRRSAGMGTWYSLPPPPALMSASNTAAISAGVRVRACTIWNAKKSIVTLESEREISPVMELAVELAARQ